MTEVYLAIDNTGAPMGRQALKEIVVTLQPIERYDGIAVKVRLIADWTDDEAAMEANRINKYETYEILRHFRTVNLSRFGCVRTYNSIIRVCDHAGNAYDYVARLGAQADHDTYHARFEAPPEPNI